jgi:ribose transport system permease protein
MSRPVPAAKAVSADEVPATGAISSRRAGSRRLEALAGQQLLVAFLLLAGIFAALYPQSFATVESGANMARVASILFVVSLGQMFVLVVGGFDLSVAANMGFAGTLAAQQMVESGSMTQGIVVGLAAGALIGLVNGVLVAVLRVTPFVVTLGTLTFLTGYGNQISGGQSIGGLPDAFRYFGGQDWGPLPSAFVIALIAMLAAWFILARTRAGLYVYAIGGSRETARVAGVRVARYEVLAYTLCGTCAALAGLMLAARVSVAQQSLGATYDLLSIATCVIGGVAIGGGIGRVGGVFSGVLLLTVLTTGLDIAGLNQFVQQMIIGVIVVLAVLLARLRTGRGSRWRDLVRLTRRA